MVHAEDTSEVGAQGDKPLARIVAIHSFQGGTGKSSIIANVAAQLALRGRRVGLVDVDLQTPGLHMQLRPAAAEARTIHDYLLGECTIEEAAEDMGGRLGQPLPDGGALYLIPGGTRTTEITRGIRGRYGADPLHEGFQTLIARLRLDYLLLDTHSGMCQETLLALAAGDLLLLVLRPDAQDYLGTAIMLEVAGWLEMPRVLLVLNMALPGIDREQACRQLESTYGCPVAAVMNLSEELALPDPGPPVSIRAPGDDFSQGIAAIVGQIELEQSNR